MRLNALLAAASCLLLGCGGPHAEVEGTTLGVEFGETGSVFFGGPFVVISNLDTDCMGVAWVERNYQEGQAPVDGDAQVLQFAWSAEGDGIVEGTSTIDVGASVSAAAVIVTDGVISFDHASGGVMTIDTYEAEKEATGSFEGVTFDDGGILSGTFTAEWCRNLTG